MNCVLDSFRSYLAFLNIKPTLAEARLVITFHQVIRQRSGNSGPLHGAVVPILIELWARAFGLEVTTGYDQDFGPAYYRHWVSPNEVVMLNMGRFDLPYILRPPAIYLCYNSFHAIFSADQIPTDLPVMSIKLHYDRRI